MALAEDVLSAFYEAQDIIRAARSPFSPAGEGRSWRTAEQQEDNRHDLVRVDAYFAPTERLNNQTEFFAKFRALEYRFTAVFGAEAKNHFETIWDARNTVLISSSMLAEAALDASRGAAPLDDETRKSWEADIWSMGKYDEISPRISKAVKEIEARCRPVLTKWFKY